MFSSLKLSPCWMALGTVLLLGAGCGKPNDHWPANKSPHVLVSFAPLHCFAANVAGEDAAVLSLLPVGSGPHDYNPTSQDMHKVRGADLFFINGLGLDEHFAVKLRDRSANPKLPLIELGEMVPNKIPVSTADIVDDGHGHVHGEFDPHVWLGIPEAIVMVEGIRDQLKKTAPAKAPEYDRRAADYSQRLRKIHEEGKAQLADVKQEDRKLVAFHDSLRYFARAYDLNVVGFIQVQPGVAPEVARITKLINRCKQENVRVVAVESQFSRETAERLFKDMPDVKIIEIDPLETAAREEFGPDYYERKMKANIDNLAKALK